MPYANFLGDLTLTVIDVAELLVASNQKGLASQAMRELANLLYHTGNIRGAYRWWSEASDILLNTKGKLFNNLLFLSL